MWTQTAVGTTLGLGISMAMIRWVAPLGWMDRPDQARKKHSHPTARTGGIALWAILILAQLTGAYAGRLHPLEWGAIHAMALLGLLDDRFDLRARYKALVGLGVALVLALHVSFTMGNSGRELSFLGIDLPSASWVITPILMLWFWAVPQAYNLIDGINGLSLGFGALLLGVLGWNLGYHPMLLWGGLTAVLMLNYPKARHFLGDCGALMLGTLFAVIGVEAFALSDPNLLLWVYAYPTVDVFLVVGIRSWKGEPLGGADRSHLHHWMIDRLGGRAWLATPVLLGMAALPMLRATAIPGHQAASVLGLLALIFLALKVFKDRVSGHEKTEAMAQVRREIPVMVSGALRETSGSHRIMVSGALRETSGSHQRL